MVSKLVYYVFRQHLLPPAKPPHKNGESSLETCQFIVLAILFSTSA